MPEISIILPCLNEELALPSCLDEIERVIQMHNLDAEIIIVDNGSTDMTVSVAEDRIKKNSAIHLYNEDRRGYGSAYTTGFSKASGKTIIMADADTTYDFDEIPKFISKIEAGADLVVGNRFASVIEKGVMPWHHQYIGNPFLSFLVKKLCNVKIHDIHCGMRAITRNAFDIIKPHTQGMEFASEVIIKAAAHGLQIEEIPIQYRKRTGSSKLRWFRDGTRHVFFILLFKIHHTRI